MKKLIIVFSKFLLISIVIYCIVVIGLYKKNISIFANNIPNKESRRSAFTAKKLEDVRRVKSTDVLILGSSLAYRNYSPDVLKQNNYSAFNLGTSSQKPNMSQILVERYVKNIKSKLVIIDVNPYLMLMPDSFETIDGIMNSSASRHDWGLFMAQPSLMAFNSLIIKYSGFAEKDRMEKLNDSIHIKDSKYLGNGFVGSSVIYDPKKKTPKISVRKLQPMQNQVDALEEIIGYLKSKNINYILVLSPVNPDYFLNKSKIKSKQFRDLSKTYFSKYGNYIDSNDLAVYDESEFMDFSHLNETGSEKFTKSLIPFIENHINN